MYFKQGTSGGLAAQLENKHAKFIPDTTCERHFNELSNLKVLPIEEKTRVVKDILITRTVQSLLG